MTSNVVKFPDGKIEPEEVLRLAGVERWKEILVIGTREGDNCVVFSGSTGYAPDLLWLMEKVRFYLLHEVDE